MPGNNIIRTRYVTMTARRQRNKMGKFIQISSQFQERSGIEMTSSGHGQSHTKEYDTVLAVFHALSKIHNSFHGNTGAFLDRCIQCPALYDGPQGPKQLKITARFNLQKYIRNH